MARSMTGFGEGRSEIDGCEYRVEIRSVNARHFKATVRLPEIWSFLETDVEQLLRSRLHRGTVYFVLRMKSSSADAAHEVNTPALERYIEQLETVRPDQADVNLTVDLASLLLLPGVCTPPGPDQLSERAGSALIKIIDQAVNALLAMRTTEGQVITKDLLGHCDVIERDVAAISGKTDTVVEDYHRRLKRRVEQLTAGANLKIDEQDLAREVAIFAERCDIAEELSRLGGHLDHFRAILANEDQPGRKLDFIAQEMLREANTIAAKANDGEIAKSVVEIKTAVDRIKEQVQNVE